MMLWMILKWLGSSVSIGLIFWATGLYFLPAKIVRGVLESIIEMCTVFARGTFASESEKKGESVGELESHSEK